MDEYIKRESVIDLITRRYENPEICTQEINSIPAADVAPVVRCKDCKHFNHKRMECENEAISTDHEGGAQYSLNFWPDDFCSYGEPKEG